MNKLAVRERYYEDKFDKLAVREHEDDKLKMEECDTSPGGSPYGQAEQRSSLCKDEFVSQDQAERQSSHHDESSSLKTQPVTLSPTKNGAVVRYVDRPMISKVGQKIL